MLANTPASVSTASSKNARKRTNHAAYHGRRYGSDNASTNSTIPHSAIGARASASHTRRTSRHRRAAKRIRKAASVATRAPCSASTPATGATNVCTARATKWEGLAQDSIPPRLANGANGCVLEKNGPAAATVSTAVTSKWGGSARTPRGRASHTNHSRSTGSITVLIRHATVISAVTASARADLLCGAVTTRAHAAASGKAISAST